VTIPQLLISYYDEEHKLIWVDHQFLEEGIRVQRKQFFTYKPLAIDGLCVIESSLENCFVNGIPNASISKKIFPNREYDHGHSQIQPYDGEGFSYLKFDVNNYIGNPK